MSETTRGGYEEADYEAFSDDGLRLIHLSPYDYPVQVSKGCECITFLHVSNNSKKFSDGIIIFAGTDAPNCPSLHHEELFELAVDEGVIPDDIDPKYIRGGIINPLTLKYMRPSAAYPGRIDHKIEEKFIDWLSERV